MQYLYLLAILFQQWNFTKLPKQRTHFTVLCSYASTASRVVILYVRLSHTCFDKTKEHTADILIPRERATTLVL